MEKPLTRTEAFCLTVMLYLSMFWRWINLDVWDTKTEERLFWGVTIILAPLGYLMFSSLCAIGADCTLANASFANWVFSLFSN